MSETGKLRIRCPDCGSALVIDRATGEILFHKPSKEPPAGGKDFDELLAGLDQERADAEEVFSREVEALKDRDRLLEEKFREAVERAADEPDDEPPPRPFDLD